MFVRKKQKIIAILAASLLLAAPAQAALHENCKDLITQSNQRAFLQRAILYAPQGAEDNLESVVKSSGADEIGRLTDFTGTIVNALPKISDFNFSDLGTGSFSLWAAVSKVAQLVAARAYDAVLDSMNQYLTTRFNNFINQALNRVNRVYENAVDRLAAKSGRFGGVFVDTAFSGLLKNSLNQLANCAKTNSVVGSVSNFSANTTCYEDVLKNMDSILDENRLTKGVLAAWNDFERNTISYYAGNKVRNAAWAFEQKHSTFAKHLNSLMPQGLLWRQTFTDNAYNWIDKELYIPAKKAILEEIQETGYSVEQNLGNFARTFGKEE